MTTEFKDHFSDQSANYSAYRPRYPEALFTYLASITPGHAHAWDCATGSGQAAVALARHYRNVTATDASASQIQNAEQFRNITYKVEPAECTSIAPASVDLITVAQALHWFDLPAFTQEVLRVLKPQGVLAVWTYGLVDITPTLDAVIQHLYTTTLDLYWPPERMLVEQGYTNVSFPLQEITPPHIVMQSEWDLSQLTGYLCTWSAVKKYTAAIGNNPVEQIYTELVRLWGDPQQPRKINWPLTLKIWQREAS